VPLSRIQEYKRNLSLALQGARYEEALAILGKLVSQAENQPAYHNQIGDIYLKTGKQSQAVDSFMQGVEGYQLLEMYPNGAALCKKVLRLEPMHKDAAWVLGELKTRQGFLADGAEKMLEALHMFVEDPATTRDSILEKLNLAEQLQGGCLEVLEFAATTYAQFGESQSARGVTLRIADIEEREGNVEKASSLRAFAEQFVADETEPPPDMPAVDQVSEANQAAVTEPAVDQVSEADQAAVTEPAVDQVSEADQAAVKEPAVDQVSEANQAAVTEPVPVPEQIPEPHEAPQAGVDSGTGQPMENDPPTKTPVAADSGEDRVEDIIAPIIESVSDLSTPPETDQQNFQATQTDASGSSGEKRPSLAGSQYPGKPHGILSLEDESLLETFDSGLPEVDVELLTPVTEISHPGEEDFAADLADLPESDVELLQPAGAVTGKVEPATGGNDPERIELDEMIPREHPPIGRGGVPDTTLQGTRKPLAADVDDLEMTIHAFQVDSPADATESGQGGGEIPVPETALPGQSPPHTKAEGDTAETTDSSDEGEPVVLRFDDNESPSLLHQILEETIQGGPITVGLTTTAGEAFQTDDIGQVLKEFRTRMAEQADNMALDERYQLGVSYMEMDLYSEALQEFQTTLDHPTLGKKSREWMGRCYLALDRPKEIITLLDPYLKNDPYPQDSSIELYYLLGQAYQLLNNNDLALDALSKVYSLNKDFRDVQNRLENLTVPG
jgi:tetratricopeptide (TPR) repeat protein